MDSEALGAINKKKLSEGFLQCPVFYRDTVSGTKTGNFNIFILPPHCTTTEEVWAKFTTSKKEVHTSLSR